MSASGKYRSSRVAKASGRGTYLTILNETRKTGFRLNEDDGFETNLDKVFMQKQANPCPTKYIRHKDWKDKKNVAPEGKIFPGERVTFT